MSRVLVIPDLHLPFEHDRALKFCKAVYKRFDCNKVICTGDMLDIHQISRHVSEPDSMGATEELAAAKRKIKEWAKAFPKLDLVIGNHDAIPKRQAKEVGLPSAYLKDIKEVYGMPNSWKLKSRVVQDGVLYIHNAGSGKYAAINKAKDMSMSVVCGHTHRHGGTIYFSNPFKLFFGMNVGCLIDKDTYAMRYNNNEPSLGCGVVIDGHESFFIPMKMGTDRKKYEKKKGRK